MRSGIAIHCERERFSRRHKTAPRSNERGAVSVWTLWSLLGNIPVGAMDRIIAGVVIPIGSFADRVPLGFRALIGDGGQSGAA